MCIFFHVHYIFKGFPNKCFVPKRLFHSKIRTLNWFVIFRIIILSFSLIFSQVIRHFVRKTFHNFQIWQTRTELRMTTGCVVIVPMNLFKLNLVPVSKGRGANPQELKKPRSFLLTVDPCQLQLSRFELANST